MTPPMRPDRRASIASTALARNDRLAKWLKYAVLALLVYIGTAATAAGIFGVTSAKRSERHALDAERHAESAERYAFQALEQARVNTGIGSDVRSLVAAQGPCLPEDGPDSPACLRDRQAAERLEHAIGRVTEAIAAGIAAHDLNTHKQHEALRQRLGVTNAMPRPAPITPHQSTATFAPTTAAPTTTATTCPKLPNGKCRP